MGYFINNHCYKQFTYHLVGVSAPKALYKMLGAAIKIWYIFNKSASSPADSFFIIGNWVLNLDKKRQQRIKKVNI
jgi:hypothetical protein